MNTAKTADSLQRSLHRFIQRGVRFMPQHFEQLFVAHAHRCLPQVTHPAQFPQGGHKRCGQCRQPPGEGANGCIDMDIGADTGADIGTDIGWELYRSFLSALDEGSLSAAARDPPLVRLLPAALTINLDTWLTMHEDLRHSLLCKVTFEALLQGLLAYVTV